MNTTETLILGLVQDHLKNYCYNNYALFAEGCKPVNDRAVSSIDVDHPAYCYQHNEHILKTLLHAGIDRSRVERRGALVVNKFDGEQDDKQLSNTVIPHSIVLVDKTFIVDVGFGGNSLRGPLPFHSIEEEVFFHGEIYRFKRCQEFQHSAIPQRAEWWGVMIRTESRWLELWRFPIDVEMNRAELEVMNSNLFLTPQPVNIRDVYLLLGRVTPTARVYMYSRKHSAKPNLKKIEISSEDGSTRRSEIDIESLNNFDKVCKEEFDISLPPDSIQKILYFGD